jgi:hypothetical protein
VNAEDPTPHPPIPEPAPSGLTATHELELSVRVLYDGRPLTRYVYRRWDPRLESPRPYFHPLRTLGGDVVSAYRPHDHVWHKGLSLSLPNVGTENFWGGVTFRRGRGYAQYDNNGSMDHETFEHLSVREGLLRAVERLRWRTQAGEPWIAERRRFAVTVRPDLDAWILVFETAITNVRGGRIVFGSPTTEGRENAGYGGLFWRGPRSFTGGVVRTPAGSGGDDLMGVRAPWVAFTGVHDGHGRSSTLVFVDAAGNEDGGHVRWFVRSTPYACVCPAPFFDTEVALEDGQTLVRRYAVVVADGNPRAEGAATLAQAGLATLDLTAPTRPDPQPACDGPADHRD